MLHNAVLSLIVLSLIVPSCLDSIDSCKTPSSVMLGYKAVLVTCLAYHKSPARQS